MILVILRNENSNLSNKKFGPFDKVIISDSIIIGDDIKVAQLCRSSKDDGVYWEPIDRKKRGEVYSVVDLVELTDKFDIWWEKNYKSSAGKYEHETFRNLAKAAWQASKKEGI
jgi:hypothetical protein